jgi:AraC-like DNA-binding protein
MRYAEFAPSPALARYVKCFWTLSGDRTSPAQPPEPILPDGCIELVLNFADRFKRTHADGRTEIQLPRFVVGQMEESVLIQPTGTTDLLGIRFRTGGAFPALRVPLEEITGSILPLGQISSALDRALATRICDAPSSSARIAAAEQALLGCIRSSRDDDHIVHAAVGAIAKQHGVISISRLARALSVNSRKLERNFLERVGLGPKRLCRILRFQRVLQAVERFNTGEWAAVAVECGYYDQAHLIRDFRDFSGLTPAALFSADMLLTGFFAHQNRVSNFYNPSG